jgi:hypothetical protein
MYGLIFAAMLAQQPWVITDTATVPPTPVPAYPEMAAVGDCTEYVYPIHHADGTAGGCVAIGNGTFQTVAHIFYPFVNGQFQKRPAGSTGECAVQIKNVWRPASYRIVDSSDDGDVALVRVNVEVPRVAVVRRAPRYMEKVLVYGLKTGFVQCGMVSGTREISLLENEVGTSNGDSGGGVFSETGEFLGTIQGGDQKEKRVVKFRPNNFEVSVMSAPPTPVQSAKPSTSVARAPAVQRPAVQMRTECANGRCWQVPVQSSQQQSSGHYERGGLFGGKTIWVPNQ